MVEILIQGGDSDTAAREMHAAIREIFGIDALRSTRGGDHAPGTRNLELVLMVLAIPPAIIGTVDMIARAKVGALFDRLFPKAVAQEKATDATITIDFGDGKPIPLHPANREKILDGLKRLESRPKS